MLFPRIMLEKKKVAYFLNKKYNSVYVDYLVLWDSAYIFSYNSSRIHLTLPGCLISY